MTADPLAAALIYVGVSPKLAPERSRIMERYLAAQGVYLVTAERLAAALRQHDKDYAADWRAGDKSWTWERKAAAILAALEAAE